MRSNILDNVDERSTTTHLISADGCWFGFLLDKLKASIRKFYDRHRDLVNPLLNITDHGHAPLFVSTPRFSLHSWHITVFLARISRRMPLVKQKLLALLAPHDITPVVLSGVRIWHSLVFCIVACISLLFLLLFFFWQLYFVSVDLRIVITLLVSSNSFYIYNLNSLQTKY